MAITLRLKRRSSGGAAGAPAALKSAEPAFNEADKILYYGFGDDGGANATSIIPIGGEGAFLTLATVQTVTGNKTFTGTVTVPTPTAGDHAATKAYVDGAVSSVSIPDGDKGDITISSSGTVWTIDNGVVTNAKLANVATATIKGRATAGTGAPEDLTATQVKTLLALTKNDVGLGNVDNTADAAKNVATAATWTTARTLTVGGTGKSVNGSANVAWSLAEIFSASQTAKTFLAAPTGAAGAPTFRTIVAADLPDLSGTYQPLDAELSALAGLTSAANKLPRFTGSGTADLLDFSTDGTLAANSDTTIASQKAVKTYVDGLLAANDAMVFKGVINASANPNYPAADAGHTYRISVAGKIGGASGPNVEAGDMLICTTDGTAAGTQATVGANWAIIQTNIDGALTTANIGSTVQAYDATLQNLAGLATAANQGLYLTGTDTFATFSLTAGGRALGGVAGTANTFPYFSAANTVTLGSITAAGLAILAAADATAQRTALGLGTMATQNANAVAITGGTIDGVVLDGGVY
ncbi:hypothetical protein LJB71_08330 [Thermomonas sp. S9]|uniref:hypothetical protein n=1 Tax=Thermomonas sp. S9 TaxID=2885203 RepID=UPI00216B621E|nr:hypothetical protein [Thermomonas sp. S9]MCR6496222.1 hypothetical protein [Thermomonas sp. S9]